MTHYLAWSIIYAIIFTQITGDMQGAIFGGMFEGPLRPTAKRKYQVSCLNNVKQPVSWTQPPKYDHFHLAFSPVVFISSWC